MAKKQGFIKFIILILIGIIILGYFKVDLRQIMQSETVRDNLNYVREEVGTVWYQYLATPVNYLWNKVIIGLIWNNFRLFIERWQA